MTLTDTNPLTEARQRVADAQARVAELRGKAIQGEAVLGAELAAAVADAELAALVIPGLEAAAVEQAEAARVATIDAAAAEFLEAEPVAASAFLAAVEGFRVAAARVRDAGQAHGALVAQLGAVAASAPPGPGEAVRRPSIPGLPPSLAATGYRAAPTIEWWTWLRRLAANADVSDLYPKEDH